MKIHNDYYVSSSSGLDEAEISTKLAHQKNASKQAASAKKTMKGDSSTQKVDSTKTEEASKPNALDTQFSSMDNLINEIKSVIKEQIRKNKYDLKAGKVRTEDLEQVKKYIETSEFAKKRKQMDKTAADSIKVSTASKKDDEILQTHDTLIRVKELMRYRISIDSAVEDGLVSGSEIQKLLRSLYQGEIEFNVTLGVIPNEAKIDYDFYDGKYNELLLLHDVLIRIKLLMVKDQIGLDDAMIELDLKPREVEGIEQYLGSVSLSGSDSLLDASRSDLSSRMIVEDNTQFSTIPESIADTDTMTSSHNIFLGESSRGSRGSRGFRGAGSLKCESISKSKKEPTKKLLIFPVKEKAETNKKLPDAENSGKVPDVENSDAIANEATEKKGSADKLLGYVNGTDASHPIVPLKNKTETGEKVPATEEPTTKSNSQMNADAIVRKTTKKKDVHDNPGNSLKGRQKRSLKDSRKDVPKRRPKKDLSERSAGKIKFKKKVNPKESRQTDAEGKTEEDPGFCNINVVIEVCPHDPQDSAKTNTERKRQEDRLRHNSEDSITEDSSEDITEDSSESNSIVSAGDSSEDSTKDRTKDERKNMHDASPRDDGASPNMVQNIVNDLFFGVIFPGDDSGRQQDDNKTPQKGRKRSHQITANKRQGSETRRVHISKLTAGEDVCLAGEQQEDEEEEIFKKSDVKKAEKENKKNNEGEEQLEGHESEQVNTEEEEEKNGISAFCGMPLPFLTKQAMKPETLLNCDMTNQLDLCSANFKGYFNKKQETPNEIISSDEGPGVQPSVKDRLDEESTTKSMGDTSVERIMSSIGCWKNPSECSSITDAKTERMCNADSKTDTLDRETLVYYPPEAPSVDHVERTDKLLRDRIKQRLAEKMSVTKDRLTTFMKGVIESNNENQTVSNPDDPEVEGRTDNLKEKWSMQKPKADGTSEQNMEPLSEVSELSELYTEKDRANLLKRHLKVIKDMKKKEKKKKVPNSYKEKDAMLKKHVKEIRKINNEQEKVVDVTPLAKEKNTNSIASIASSVRRSRRKKKSTASSIASLTSSSRRSGRKKKSTASSIASVASFASSRRSFRSKKKKSTSSIASVASSSRRSFRRKKITSSNSSIHSISSVASFASAASSRFSRLRRVKRKKKKKE